MRKPRKSWAARFLVALRLRQKAFHWCDSKVMIMMSGVFKWSMTIDRDKITGFMGESGNRYTKKGIVATNPAGIVYCNMRTLKVRTIFMVMALVIGGWLRADAATIDTVLTYSASMKKNIKAVVIRPDGPAGKHYPVLYLLHGAGGDYTDWI